MTWFETTSVSLLGLLGDQTSLDRQSLRQAIRTLDPALWHHAREVAGLADSIAAALTFDWVSRQALVDAAWFHDIGKLSIAREIIDKPGALDQREWARIRRHPAEAAEYLERFSEFQDAVPSVRHHHERFDGGGYPDGLGGDEIPLGARIVGIADAYHAMIVARPYRRQRTPGEAIAELRRCAGTQFDPSIVEQFVQNRQHQAVLFNR